MLWHRYRLQIDSPTESQPLFKLSYPTLLEIFPPVAATTLNEAFAKINTARHEWKQGRASIPPPDEQDEAVPGFVVRGHEPMNGWYECSWHKAKEEAEYWADVDNRRIGFDPRKNHAHQQYYAVFPDNTRMLHEANQ